MPTIPDRKPGLQKMSKKKSGRGKTLLIVSCLVIVLASGGIFYLSNVDTAKPVTTTASVKPDNISAATVLVPDGQGNCHKYVYGNETGKSSYAGTVACDTAPPKGARSNLPPALRGMQDTLGR